MQNVQTILSAQTYIFSQNDDEIEVSNISKMDFHFCICMIVVFQYLKSRTKRNETEKAERSEIGQETVLTKKGKDVDMQSRGWDGPDLGREWYLFVRNKLYSGLGLSKHYYVFTFLRDPYALNLSHSY